MMKSNQILIGVLFIIIPYSLLAQETTVITINRDDGSIGEQYEVLKKKKSVKNGSYKRFYKDGQVNIQANFTNNILNGPFESLHPNGHSAAAGIYESGMKTGDWVYSDAEGTISVKGAFNKDQETGPWKYTNPEGFEITTDYLEGNLNGTWELRFSGQLLASAKFNQGLPDPESLKLPTDSIYRYADSLYQIPQVKAYFSLLEFPEKFKIFGSLPSEPRFLGGIESLRDYLGSAVKLPISAFPGPNSAGTTKRTCYVQLTISQFGTIENVIILKSFSVDMDREIIKAVKEMPIWMPAINRNIPVRSMITIPFSFQTIMK